MEALSDELRVRIFAYLCLHAAGSKEIAAALGVSEPSVRYRLEQLRKGGWIAIDPSIRKRGHQYRAVRAMVIPPEVWDRLPELARRKVAAGMLNRLYADLSASIEGGRFLRPGTHMSLTPLVVDAIGKRKVEQVMERALSELAMVQKESDVRVQAGIAANPVASLTAGLVGFESLRDPAEGARASATMRL